jgi:hypothetical protein
MKCDQEDRRTDAQLKAFALGETLAYQLTGNEVHKLNIERADQTIYERRLVNSSGAECL